MKFCPECGAPVSEANKFCPNCGFKLSQGESQSIPTIPAAPTATGIPETSSEPVEPTENKPPVKDMSGLPPAWMPAPVQPGTGTRIEARESSASGAGSASDNPAPIAPPPSFMPPPVQSTFGGSTADRPGGFGNISDDFKMSDLGPPPPPKRRLWLWIPLGVIGFVILCCIVFVLLSETVLEDTFDGWATDIATDSTEESVGP